MNVGRIPQKRFENIRDKSGSLGYPERITKSRIQGKGGDSYCQTPGDVRVEGTLLRSIDWDLKCRRPPLISGPGFQLNPCPIVLSTELKTSASLV